MLQQLLQIDLVILFFFLGLGAAWVGSDLDFPDAISKFLSIFLLISLGLKGGHEVRQAENVGDLGLALAIGVCGCLLIPVYLFHFFKRKLGIENAAAVGASYGSVSAVTFIAAQGYLNNLQIPYNGHMVAVMALMEMPAVVVALMLYRESKGQTGRRFDLSVFSAKSVVLLGGGFVIGLLMNDSSWNSITPVIKDNFKGFLAIFLLDLGVQAQRKLRDATKAGLWAPVIGLVLPLLHGSLTLGLAHLLGLQTGDSVLIATLVGSASYIAAPAAVRASIPDANPGLYVALPLAFTFPMHVIVGIPWYLTLAGYLKNL